MISNFIRQETYNNLYGLTKNPYKLSRTVGGSSGGEGAIVTACGSAWGLGTDIGGSIRMPAFYCGIFGHKPTSELTNMKGDYVITFTLNTFYN